MFPPFFNRLTTLIFDLILCLGESHIDQFPTYYTKGPKRGKALIINNIKFLEDKNERKGAEKDEKNLKELLRKIGFDVLTYTNLKKSVSYIEESKSILMNKSNIFYERYISCLTLNEIFNIFFEYY